MFILIYRQDGEIGTVQGFYSHEEAYKQMEEEYFSTLKDFNLSEDDIYNISKDSAFFFRGFCNLECIWDIEEITFIK